MKWATAAVDRLCSAPEPVSDSMGSVRLASSVTLSNELLPNTDRTGRLKYSNPIVFDLPRTARAAAGLKNGNLRLQRLDTCERIGEIHHRI